MKTRDTLLILEFWIVSIGLLIAVYLIFRSPVISVPPKAEKVVALATDDLAKGLKINPKEIQLIGIEEVRWPDSCLGIHEPGVQCLDVITHGYRLFFRAGEKIWVYHTSETLIRRVDVP